MIVLFEEIEKEIWDNMAIIKSMRIPLLNDKNESIPIVPSYLMEVSEVEFKHDKEKETGSMLIFLKSLKIDVYEKNEDKLIEMNTEESKRVIKLYDQFKVWNQNVSKSVLSLSVEEYIDFRKVLLEELPKYPMKFPGTVEGLID